MPNDKQLHFHCDNVTYNDIHDNNNCTIYTAERPDPIKVAPPREDTPKRYAVTAQWLQQEKAAGRDYYTNCQCNYTKLADFLSQCFGWPVESKQLYTAICSLK